MAILTYAKFQILVSGIYGWGVGYYKADYVPRWDECCTKIKEANLSFFDSTSLVFPTPDHNISPRFIGEDFYAYMHPMEIAGHALSSSCCITENEGENFGNRIKESLDKVVAIIKDCFPEIDIKVKTTVWCNKFDDSKPTYTITD